MAVVKMLKRWFWLAALVFFGGLAAASAGPGFFRESGFAPPVFKAPLAQTARQTILFTRLAVNRGRFAGFGFFAEHVKDDLPDQVRTSDDPEAFLHRALVLLSLALCIALSLSIHYKISHSRTVKRLQESNEKLLQLDKLKDQFLANTSHELRTPLNGIIGLSESVLDGAAGPVPKGVAHNLSMVAFSARRLSNMVEELLDFAKIKNQALDLRIGAINLRDITDLVLAICRPLVGQKKLVLANNVSESLRLVAADENRLQQVLYNLVGNAVKFTEEGMVKVSAREVGEEMEIRVADTGIGIPREQMERVFISFEQLNGSTDRDYGGTGLGLAITKRLVELQGGRIWVDENANRGAVLAFTLPLAQRGAGPPSVSGNAASTIKHHFIITNPDETQSGPAPGVDGPQSKILVVDDDPINRQILRNHLTLRNYSVVEAADGFAALKAIDNLGKVDLILLDIMMPRMSGYEVCKRLRQRFQFNELPIIFLSAKNQIENLEAGFEAGANDYLTKPIAKHELLPRVQTHLKLLNATRYLEDQVSKRTQDLDRKNKQLNEANLKLKTMSVTDPLTGLSNRRFLLDNLDRDIFEIDRIHRDYLSGKRTRLPEDAFLLFMMVDVDHFKSVNDTHGHDAGDKVLIQLRDLMQRATRDSDWLVRWGGEEFLIIVRRATRKGGAILAERLRHMVESFSFDIGDGKVINRTVSIGFATYPFHQMVPTHLSWQDVLRVVDMALYAAKHSSRNAWVGLSATGGQVDEGFFMEILDDPQGGIDRGHIQAETSVRQARLTWS